ncbi:MAG: serine/threonine-protein kinase [Polyangiales bacterium]
MSPSSAKADQHKETSLSEESTRTLADSNRPERAAPERIGRYRLCFELASGGMATVYLARADGVSGFEKLVALKRIHRHLAKEREYVDMFLDEARIASRITHANVCSVFDFGESNGEYFIAMEYLVGEPLSRVYRHVASDPNERQAKLLPLRMARLVADACEGLHAAHELRDNSGQPLNVVHRDVSPRNLFLTYDGIVQVVDFGIASATQRVHQTSTGQVKGTFPYMAPEQMTGATAIDRRVDIWALGVVLWEMLTSRRLFRRDTDVNTMYAVLSDEVKPPSHFRSDIPPTLDAIVLRALQRDPNNRYQTAREMGQALRQFLARQKDIVGPVELSDWMQQLFPQGEFKAPTHGVGPHAIARRTGSPFRRSRTDHLDHRNRYTRLRRSRATRCAKSIAHRFARDRHWRSGHARHRDDLKESCGVSATSGSTRDRRSRGNRAGS